MRLLLDTNVLLDLALARLPWAHDAAALLGMIERQQIEGYVASHALTTVYYVVARARDRRVAAGATADLLRLLRVVPLETADFQQALALGIPDFEDAVHAVAGLKVGADYIVTRNERDFRTAPIVARSAGEVLALI